MTTTTSRLPETPADVAADVLDAIEQHPQAFDMNSWVESNDEIALPPAAAPQCGTTLCAAGWAAHVTGWTLVNQDRPVQVGRVDENGTPGTAWATCFAEKGDERRFIGDVAAEALGLEGGQTFWYSDANDALLRLRRIAGRPVVDGEE